MPTSRSRRTPAAATPATAGTPKTATKDLTQVTWTKAGRTYSREWTAGPQNRDSIRAAYISLMGSGAGNVSTQSIPAGADYTEYGER